MRKSLIFFIVFSWNISCGLGQTVISGKISGKNEKNLSGATVTISRDSTAAILAYAISDTDGKFSIDLNIGSDSVFLKISYVGYTTWAQMIPNKTQQLEVKLSPSLEELKEVFLESTVIELTGDTISYNVSAFKGQKDRVIADVLAKMPGIEIKSSGAIYYQGKPIQKYYIEGLDLLEGRYSLANENLPVNSVSEVQILENHQPIKVLDSLVFSERASLNIKLKKDVTVTGSAEIGAGFSIKRNMIRSLIHYDIVSIFQSTATS